MKKLIALLITSTFALSGCATLVENDIFTPSKPDPNEAYEDANKADELRDCIRRQERNKNEPTDSDCYLKNR